jgi:hypothetical protein
MAQKKKHCSRVCVNGQQSSLLHVCVASFSSVVCATRGRDKNHDLFSEQIADFWSRVILEKLIVSQQLKKFLLSVRPDGSVPCSQKPTIGPIPKQINPVYTFAHSCTKLHCFNIAQEFQTIRQETLWCREGKILTSISSRYMISIL